MPEDPEEEEGLQPAAVRSRHMPRYNTAFFIIIPSFRINTDIFYIVN